MATLTITRGTTLPNSSAKSDFHNLIDTATGSVSNIVNADIDASAAIAGSKLDLSSISQNLVMNGKIFKMAKGADVASVAGAITLGDDGNYFDITGTNAITSITAKTAGTMVVLQFDSTASLIDGSNLKLAGNFTGAAESQIALISDGTNWFEVCRQPNTFTPTVSNALSGSVIQTVKTINLTASTVAVAMPIDDTIPQNTEGGSLGVDTAITPNNSSNRLRITVVANGSFISTQNTTAGLALFQDSTADALCASANTITNNATTNQFVLVHEMAAGTTSATTFKARIGESGGGTFTINGQNGSRIFGGVLNCIMVIEEIKA